MAHARAPLTGSRVAALSAALAIVLGVTTLAALALGAVHVPLGKIVDGSLTPVQRTILLDVRLPRVLLSALLGGALAVAGVVFQAMLRNPLADPYVLGVSGGASIGGVLAILFGVSGLAGGLGLPALAFAGALGALVLIRWVATVDGRLGVFNVLLTGVIFNAFSAALIYFIQSVASLEELHAIVFYLMGRMPSHALPRIAVVALVVVAAVVALSRMAREYNALSLGEDAARQLGVDVESVQRRTFVLGSLLTGVAVALAGLIGFVGLVVPHILRLVWGPDHRVLLPSAFLGGAAFLVLADLLSRTVDAPQELPVGVITALVGGPFFLYLLRTRRGGHGF